MTPQEPLSKKRQGTGLGGRIDDTYIAAHHCCPHNGLWSHTHDQKANRLHYCTKRLGLLADTVEKRKDRQSRGNTKVLSLGTPAGQPGTGTSLGVGDAESVTYKTTAHNWKLSFLSLFSRFVSCECNSESLIQFWADAFPGSNSLFQGKDFGKYLT